MPVCRKIGVTVHIIFNKICFLNLKLALRCQSRERLGLVVKVLCVLRGCKVGVGEMGWDRSLGRDCCSGLADGRNNCMLYAREKKEESLLAREWVKVALCLGVINAALWGWLFLHESLPAVLVLLKYKQPNIIQHIKAIHQFLL